MKVVSALLITCLIMGCGILEMLFPIDNFPQRYIERDVGENELVGIWNLTSDSELRMNAYFRENQNEDLSWEQAPWKTITLNEDGTCKISFEISWGIDNKVLTEPDAHSNCTWEIDKISGYGEDLSSKYVPGLFLRFEHYNKEEDMYYVYYSEPYLAEENNELVLWYFIGDPLERQYQDFKKTIQ